MQCNSCSCVPAKTVTTDRQPRFQTDSNGVLATHEGFTITHQFFFLHSKPSYMLALDAACDFDDKVFIPLILRLKGTGMLSLRGTTKLRGKNEPNLSALALIDDDNSPDATSE